LSAIFKIECKYHLNVNLYNWELNVEYRCAAKFIYGRNIFQYYMLSFMEDSFMEKIYFNTILEVYFNIIWIWILNETFFW